MNALMQVITYYRYNIAQGNACFESKTCKNTGFFKYNPILLNGQAFKPLQKRL